MRIPEFLQDKISKQVAVLGFGVTGKAVCRFLKNLNLDFTVYDESQTHFTKINASQHDLVIYSPGLHPQHPWIVLAKRVGALCLGELDFGALFCKASIISITGTNGKTSITEFLAYVLQRLGKYALPCGNCGVPLVDCYELFNKSDAFLVCETSSFQAETLSYLKPYSVLWTTFFEDHLDRHPSLESYFNVKWNLIYQLNNGPCYIGKTVANMAQKMQQTLPSMCSSHLSLRRGPGSFVKAPQQYNFGLVKAFWNAHSFNNDVLFDAARSFQGVPHSVQFFDKIGKVSFF